MSEFSDENTIFENLTREIEDPYVSEFFDDVRTVQQEIYNSDELSEQDRVQFMQRVNGNWIYRNHELKISGEATVITGSGVAQKVKVDSVPARSTGFNVFKLADIEPGSYDDNNKVLMTLMVKAEDGSDLYTLADIDNLTIEYPFESRDKIEQRLDNELRGYREQLDEIIFGDGDMTQVMHNLSEFIYEYDVVHGVDQGSVDALEYYINEAIGFDQQLPYYVTVQNDIYKILEDKVVERVDIEDDLYDIAKVGGILLQKTSISPDGKTECMTPYIAMEHYSHLSNQPSVGYTTDVCNIKSIIPMRDDVDTEYFD